MPKTKAHQFDRLLTSPPGRVALVMLTVMVASGVLTLLYGLALNMPVILISGIILSSLGIIAAMSARALLRNFTIALRLLSAVTALFSGLVIIGMITHGAVGITLSTWNSSSPNWNGLIQVFWSGLVTWLALRSWSKPAHLKENGVPHQEITKARQPRRSQSVFKLPEFKIPCIRMPQSLQKYFSTNKFVEKRPWLMLWQSKNEKTPGGRVMLKKSTLTHTSNKRVFNHRQESIRLVGIEEHNCPFCLESVTKNNLRGLTICSTCKTWHHADCWDMTGECQVPHQH